MKEPQTRPKLLLQTKHFSDSRNCRVRLTEAAADVVNDLWLRTGLSATEIVSTMILFADKYTEVTPSCFDSEEQTDE